MFTVSNVVRNDRFQSTNQIVTTPETRRKLLLTEERMFDIQPTQYSDLEPGPVPEHHLPNELQLDRAVKISLSVEPAKFPRVYTRAKGNTYRRVCFYKGRTGEPSWTRKKTLAGTKDTGSALRKIQGKASSKRNNEKKTRKKRADVHRTETRSD